MTMLGCGLLTQLLGSAPMTPKGITRSRDRRRETTTSELPFVTRTSVRVTSADEVN